MIELASLIVKGSRNQWFKVTYTCMIKAFVKQFKQFIHKNNGTTNRFPWTSVLHVNHKGINPNIFFSICFLSNCRIKSPLTEWEMFTSHRSLGEISQPIKWMSGFTLAPNQNKRIKQNKTHKWLLLCITSLNGKNITLCGTSKMEWDHIYTETRSAARTFRMGVEGSLHTLSCKICESLCSNAQMSLLKNKKQTSMQKYKGEKKLRRKKKEKSTLT